MADSCESDADKDIPSELYLNGCPLVAEQIFSHLTPEELCRACQVCRTWHEQISVSRPLMATLTNFCKQQQSKEREPPPRQSSDDHENSHKTQKKTIIASIHRKALTNIANINTQMQVHSKLIPVPLQPPLSRDKHVLKCRPCPDCQSPAKVLNLRRAECTRCHLDFCQYCFRLWHEGRCVMAHSPGGIKKPAVICGTKKSKSRLRRL